MIQAVRVIDLPVLVIAVAIQCVLWKVFIALWKDQGGFSETTTVIFFIAALIGSLIAAKSIWRAVRKAMNASQS